MINLSNWRLYSRIVTNPNQLRGLKYSFSLLAAYHHPFYEVYYNRIDKCFGIYKKHSGVPIWFIKGENMAFPPDYWNSTSITETWINEVNTYKRNKFLSEKEKTGVIPNTRSKYEYNRHNVYSLLAKETREWLKPAMEIFE